jgi:hypothetical protein
MLAPFQRRNGCKNVPDRLESSMRKEFHELLYHVAYIFRTAFFRNFVGIGVIELRAQGSRFSRVQRATFRWKSRKRQR